MVLRVASRKGRPFYGCPRWPRCRGSHGAHKDGRPLGNPADEATRQARMRAHEAFDRLWCGRGHIVFGRTTAYRWLREAMGVSEDEAHIACFDINQCERLIAIISETSPRLQREAAAAAQGA